MYAVLCIDDQIRSISALSIIVRSCGYICLSAQDPDEAASAYSQSKVDLVILNNDLVGGNALALAKRLKQLNDVPLILLSGTSLVEKPLNVDLVVHKPLDAREFTKMLQWIVSKSRTASSVA
ncbi:MAG: response regulator [Terriglobia bacterium]|jgi:DNA-binding response OmpR family regulator|nr:response regulator [Terriglobia bacterium]